ncbi:BrnT family toxin [Chamaesiphon sp. VAR_48_metabat_135_sub]|uniref:BrnT family toxin n=1 Tax=Chamaesiphon sp. VAR_48_metabat_135_sub TaxID=2964699 RepID=UPI00286C0413|nr:BrnT family toxin [Chamaesiphon sp. VAR_48_metabat_135_sub]
MSFEWDEEKAKSNISTHDVSFDEATSVFEDPLFLTFADPEHSIQEQRFVIMGESARGRLLVVSYTERADATRLISARQVTRKERKAYESDL